MDDLAATLGVSRSDLNVVRLERVHEQDSF